MGGSDPTLARFQKGKNTARDNGSGSRETSAYPGLGKGKVSLGPPAAV